MSKSNSADVKGRWTKKLVKELSRELIGRPLGPAVDLPTVNTIEVDGVTYLDLRGFPFDDRFKDVTIKQVDFSACTFVEPAGFARVNASTCRFIEAAISGSVSGTFSDCRFDGCIFTRPIGWPTTVFSGCCFDGANLRSGELKGSVFHNCTFRGCKMPRTSFIDCKFERCDFTGAVFQKGSLGGSVISGPMNNFKYADPNNFLIKHEFVIDPKLPTVDLDETGTVETVFRAN